MRRAWIVLMLLAVAGAGARSGIEYKPRYERPTPEALPPLEEAQRIVAARKRAKARMEIRDGRPRLVVDGKLVPPCFYVTSNTGLKPGGVSQIGDFRDAGVRIYLMFLSLGRRKDYVPSRWGTWVGPDQYDMGEIDELLWRTLRADPEGYVIFYMFTDPYESWCVEPQ